MNNYALQKDKGPVREVPNSRESSPMSMKRDSLPVQETSRLQSTEESWRFPPMWNRDLHICRISPSMAKEAEHSLNGKQQGRLERSTAGVRDQ